MRFFLCLFYMFHRRYSNCRPLNSARYNRIICQTVENTSFLGGCRAYCTRWRKVTKVTNPISDFTFLSTAKSGKSMIKNPFLDSPKGTHPQMNRWIHSGQGFFGSFDLQWSEWSRITDPDPDQPKGTHPKCHEFFNFTTWSRRLTPYPAFNCDIELL